MFCRSVGKTREDITASYMHTYITHTHTHLLCYVSCGRFLLCLSHGHRYHIISYHIIVDYIDRVLRCPLYRGLLIVSLYVFT